MLNANILLASPSTASLIFSLISPPPPNPPIGDAIKTIFYVAPHMPARLATDSLSKLADMTEAPVHHSLSSANLTHCLTNEFDFILTDARHALQKPLFRILKNLSSSHMTCADFLSLLKCVCSPVLASPSGSLELPVVWRAAAEPPPSPALVAHRASMAPEFAERIDSLADIAESSENVAYTRLGGRSFLYVRALCQPRNAPIRNPIVEVGRNATSLERCVSR